MELHDAQIAVTAIRHVLVVCENLGNKISACSHVRAAPRRILAGTSDLVPAQHQTDVLVLAHELGPHGIAVVVSSKSVVLGVEAVTSRNSRVIEVLVSMGDNDGFCTGIVLNHLPCPRKGSITRIEFEGEY